MSCEIPEAVLAYIQAVERDEPRACREQHALAKYIREVFAHEELIVDTEQLRHYLAQEQYFDFTLFPWEKACLALWLCTYKAPGVPRWETLFVMVGRGAGKDGFIAYAAFCLVGPYNRAKKYDVDICAMNEEQAMRPLRDVIDALETPRQQVKLNKYFYHTKEVVQGRKNQGMIKGRTNNPKGRDGMRSGAVIFNEVHAYENYDNIKVFRTGLGKKEQPRVGIFTSNGHVMDGPLDDYLNQGRRILLEGEPDRGFLPFICCLNEEKQVHDRENWPMANPSYPYRPTLRQQIENEYQDWLVHPEQNGDLLPKRFGLRKGFNEICPRITTPSCCWTSPS